MPSLGRYCQGVIGYRIACQASADTAKARSCLQLEIIGTQTMEMLCDRHSYFAFHTGGVQATCAINSVVDL